MVTSRATSPQSTPFSTAGFSRDSRSATSLTHHTQHRRNEPLDVVVGQSRASNEAAHGLGWKGATPFLTLAFLALSVIPSLKLTDKGLVDVDRFELVPLEA